MQTVQSSKTEQNDPVAELFSDALRLGASDIHIEPGESEINIRIRVDGHFVNYRKIAIEHKSSIVARIKIMASLKIDEQRLPQDGKAVYMEAS